MLQDPVTKSKVSGMESGMQSLESQSTGPTSQGLERPASIVPSHRRLSEDGNGPLDSLGTSLLVCGRAEGALGLLPPGSVQTVVTSPPYWSLRDYEVSDQIGCNDELREYIKSIVVAFDQVRRVLKDDGTVWLNVGDSYTSGNRKYRAPHRKNRARAMVVRPPTPEGIKPKDSSVCCGAWFLPFKMLAGECDPK